MKKVGIYIRVSTQEQALEGYSIPAQKDRLINFCKAKEWNIADIYIDGGFSGSNLDRPAMQKLINDVKSKKLDLVLVYKLDRLSRSQKDTLHLIEDVLLANDVDFVSMNESFDTSSSFGRAMIGVLSVFAQLEREQIKERSLMGRVERAKEGLFHGGGYNPIGYDYIDGKLEINDYEAMQVRMIFDMFVNKRYGIERIKNEMSGKYTNKHSGWTSHSSIMNILDTQLYTGVIVFHDTVYPGQHEAIIEPELYEKAQAIRKHNKATNEKAYQRKSLLAGLIFCKHCGGRYFLKTKSKEHKYYMCYSRYGVVKHMAKNTTCKNKNWRIDDLEKKVEEKLLRISTDKSYFESLLQEGKSIDNNKIETLVKRKTEIDKQINKLMDLYQMDKIPMETIGERISKLHEEKKIIQAEIDNNTIIKVENSDLSELLGVLSDLPLIWQYATLEEKRNILSRLIKRIDIDHDEIKIEWTFI